VCYLLESGGESATAEEIVTSGKTFRLAVIAATLFVFAGRCAGAAEDAGIQLFRDRIEPVLKRE
jgi:hypothetical protein